MAHVSLNPRREREVNASKSVAVNSLFAQLPNTCSAISSLLDGGPGFKLHMRASGVSVAGVVVTYAYYPRR